ncbi:MAG: hypothetical protein P4L46_05525 [Fimbriimonas sp.]|nr:hypothetical protein [Fimbriimonas sp.]
MVRFLVPVSLVVALSVLPVLGVAGQNLGVGQDVPIGGWVLQDVSKVPDDGSVVSSAGYLPVGWYKAEVPGTVLTSLVIDGVYPEPLYGENNRLIPESLCRTSYWYRTEFAVPPAFGARGIHSWLRFDGINYLAEVWLNGQRIGDIRGAYARGLFDIARLVKPGSKSVLVVKILPPPHPGNPLEQTQARGTGPNGGAIGADGPTFNASVGWDWIPGIRDRDMGIWQGVRLFSTGPVTVLDPYITTTLPLPRTDSAVLSVRTDLRNITDRPVSGVVSFRVAGTGWATHAPVTLQPGETKTVSAPDIHAMHPRLWWPNGYGQPNTYRLETTFRVGRSESDVKEVTFGIRSIDYFTPGGKNLTLIVNGVPVFAKGGNWGMDEAMKRSPLSRLDAQMRLHRDANFTIIRNWVGMATQEDFYAMCDKYGIMVWDDFWLANPADGPIPLDPDLFLANAREKIVRFRNHPSIAVWCGRNEGFPPAKINSGLAQMVADLDGRRFYQPHSSATNGVGGGGPYAYRKPADYFQFRDAFHTEVGGPSIPTVEAIENMMPRRDWWPINDDWAEHDFCRGAQQGDRYLSVIGKRFGPVTGLEDFVRKGHLATYESYRAIYEGREEKAFDPATGVMIWMSNPSQPSFVWQLYSYDLDPTAAEFAARKGCEPIHVMLDPRDDRVSIVNNTPQPLGKLVVVASTFALNGAKIGTQTGEVDGKPSAASEVFALIRAASKESSVTFVKLELRDARHRLLSDNFYWLSPPAREGESPSDDFTDLQSMPAADLEVETQRQDMGGAVTRLSVTVRNRNKGIALMVHFHLVKGDSKTRVLPAYFSDNFFSLVPGEIKRLTVEAATADLGGEAPVAIVDGWNVRGASN